MALPTKMNVIFIEEIRVPDFKLTVVAKRRVERAGDSSCREKREDRWGPSEG